MSLTVTLNSKILLDHETVVAYCYYV